MIIVIAYTETNKRTGKIEPIVSHGVNVNTGKVIAMPPIHPQQTGAVFDHDIGEWIIRTETTAAPRQPITIP